MDLKLKNTNKDKRILKKHVSAIHIGAKLSLLQRKLVNALLYNAYDQLLTAKDHQISAALLCEMIGFDSNNSAYLKGALKGLMETVVEFDVLEDDGKQSWEAMVLLPYAKLKDGICTYRYERSLAEKLYHPDVYSKINLSVLREMKSAHALVLYENCYRYVDIGHTPWWDVDVFRKLMSVDQMTSYKQFKLLNRAVIQLAMKEVNELSNIQLELETKRKGRSVTGIRFLISPNPQLSLIGMEVEDDITEKESYKTLISEGVSKTLARAWVIEHGDDYIFEKIDLVANQEAGGRIKSTKVGFLKAAIENDYHNEQAAKRKQNQAAKSAKEARENIDRQISTLKDRKREAEAAYRKSCVDLIETAFAQLSDEEKETVKAMFVEGLSSDVYVKAFKKMGWKDRLNFSEIKRFWISQKTALPSFGEWAKLNGTHEPEEFQAQISALEEQLIKPVKLV